MRAESEPARHLPWSDAFDREISWVAKHLVSFLRFDIFCILIISPTIVPERIPIRDDDNDYDGADEIHEPRDHS